MIEELKLLSRLLAPLYIYTRQSFVIRNHLVFYRVKLELIDHLWLDSIKLKNGPGLPTHFTDNLINSKFLKKHDPWASLSPKHSLQAIREMKGNDDDERFGYHLLARYLAGAFTQPHPLAVIVLSDLTRFKRDRVAKILLIHSAEKRIASLERTASTGWASQCVPKKKLQNLRNFLKILNFGDR